MINIMAGECVDTPHQGRGGHTRSLGSGPPPPPTWNPEELAKLHCGRNYFGADNCNESYNKNRKYQDKVQEQDQDKEQDQD